MAGTKTPKEIIEIANAASDKKAENIIILDVDKLSSLASWFVFCSGTNSRQNKSIADDIYDRLTKMKRKPLHIEGASGNSGWILMDYGDIIIHIFLQETREFYDLEGLWGDAKRVNVEKLIAS